jgi:hypothetical protein
MFASDPDAPMLTVAGLAVAALVTVMESTALAVALEVMKGLLFPSLMLVTLGLVSSAPLDKTTEFDPVEAAKEATPLEFSDRKPVPELFPAAAVHAVQAPAL